MKKKLLIILPFILLAGCSAGESAKDGAVDDVHVDKLHEVLKAYDSTRKIEFINYDGSPLEVPEKVSKEFSYTGAEPKRESSREFDYNFREWGLTFDPVNKITTAKAFFDKEVRKYKIDFALPSGEIIESKEVEYGKVPEIDFEIPNEEDFIGFDKELSEVDRNATYTIKYKADPGQTYFSYGLVFEHFIDSHYDDESGDWVYEDQFAVKSYLGDDKAVIIPDTFQGEPVTKILDGAFAGNNQITSIHFGKNVKYIDDLAIFKNPEISKFTVEPGNPYLFVQKEILFQKYNGFYELVAYPAALEGTLELPQYKARVGFCEEGDPAYVQDAPYDYEKTCPGCGVHWGNHHKDGCTHEAAHFDYSINLGAFSKTKLEILKLNVNDVGGYRFNRLFNEIDALTPEFPAQLRTVFITGGDISGGYFENTTTLESIVLEDNEEAPIEEIGSLAFDGCSNIEKIVIPDTVTDIGDKAFNNCYSLKSVILGFKEMNLNDIGEKIFNGCESLKGYSKDGIEYIGNETYKHQIAYKMEDKNIDSVSFEATTIHVYDEICEGSMVKTVEFKGNKLASIGEYAFRNATKLTSISLPYSLTNVGIFSFYGLSAFYNKSDYTERYIPSNGVDHDVVDEFYVYRYNKETMVLSNETKFIDLYAFLNNNFAKKITVDSNPNFEVQDGLLFGVTNNILYSAVGAGSGALDTYHGMRYVAVSALYKTGYSSMRFRGYDPYYIGSYAFAEMTNLSNTSYSTIAFGGNTTFIGKEAFAGSGGESATLYFSFSGTALTSIGKNAFNVKGYARVTLTGISSYEDNESIRSSYSDWKTSNVTLQYN